MNLALYRDFLHGKKTGLDNFMAICEFGDESGGGAIKLGFTVHNKFFKTYRWCTRIECGRSWVRGRIKPKAIKLAFVASPLTTHSKEKQQTLFDSKSG